MRFIAAILALSLTGCGFAERHPVQAKIYIIGAGMLAGAGYSLSERRGICTTPYEGQPYYGTGPCMKEPKGWKPNGR